MYNILILSDNVLISLENEFSLLLLHSIFYAISLRGGSCFLFFFFLSLPFGAFVGALALPCSALLIIPLLALKKNRKRKNQKIIALRMQSLFIYLFIQSLKCALFYVLLCYIFVFVWASHLCISMNRCMIK